MDADVHEERLGALEDHAKKTELQLSELTHQVRGLATVQQAQNAKLDKITDALAASQYAPKFDFQKTLTTVRDLFVICSTIAVLSIWLVNILRAADTEVTNVKMNYIERTQELQAKYLEKLEGKFGWMPRIEGRAQ